MNTKIARLGWFAFILSTNCLSTGNLDVTFVDPMWDGNIVPQGQQCQKFGGSAESPKLRVSSIPKAANALLVEFSDRTYIPMDNGGHGKFGFQIEKGIAETFIPSVPSHTKVLPPGFWTVQEHKAPNWDKPGAYLPPCSGGKGNEYYLTVKAIDTNGGKLHILGEALLEMGIY